MKPVILVSSVLLIYLSAGCSSNSNDQDSAESADESQSVFQTQIDALDKAKGLEQDMKNAFEQRDREMEDQTR